MKKLYLVFVLLFECLQATGGRVPTIDENSSLACAVYWKSEEFLVNFIKNNSMSQEYVNAQDEQGDTALIVASRCGKYRVVCELLKKGAVVGHVNKRRQNARLAAAGYPDIQAILSLHVVED